MKNLFLVLFTIISLVAFSNNNENKEIKMTSFSGKVVDASETLAGVKILIDNKETDVYTDFDGNFTVENIPVGVHKISFSLVAYENKTIEIDLTKDNSLEVVLESK